MKSNISIDFSHIRKIITILIWFQWIKEKEDWFFNLKIKYIISFLIKSTNIPIDFISVIRKIVTILLFY